jgi:hypothetical protein
VDRVDEQGLHRFSHDAEPVRPHQHGMMRPKRARERAALFGQFDVARIGIDWDTALPARGARPHRQELHAFHHGKRDRELHVGMQDRLHIRPGAQDLQVNGQLAGRLAVAFQHVAVVVDDQHGVRAHLGARGRTDLDHKRIASGNAGRDVAAVVKNALGLEQPGGGRRLKHHPLDG